MAGKRVFVDLRFFYAHAALLGCKEQRTRSVSGRSRHAPAGTERDDNPFAIAPIARHLAGRERQLKSAVGKLSANAMLAPLRVAVFRSEEHTSELQSLMRISYAVFCLKK